MWSYSQTTGQLSHNGQPIGVGYAGRGQGLNNPAMESIHDLGPLPAGLYTIGSPIDKPSSVGAFALPLTPDPSNTMYGRSGFYCHGDNAAQNHTASDGCIVMARNIREQIANSGDDQLTVVA